MFLNDSDKVSGDDVEIKGQGIIAQLKAINDAVKDTFLDYDKATSNSFERLTEKLTQMENQTNGFLRSMGGVFNLLQRSNDPAERLNDTVGQFQERFMQASKSVQDFGASSKDVLQSMEGISDAMGRAVFPSQITLENMVALSKTTGLTAKEIGTMVEKMSSLGGTQEEATEKIHDMAVAARQVGLDAHKFVKSMSDNVEKVGGFGFKEGIKSLTNMTKQAQMLKTTFSSIVGTLQDTVLSPEGAIETAAKFQMLGGAVGKLGDPFQLLYMAQNDMEGLQKEIVNSTKAAFKFNKETGQFEASTQDLYRLKEQAAITGTKLEDLVKTGREAAKLDYIKDKFDLSKLDPENRELLAGLAQVGKNGEVTFDIPGFGTINQEMINSGEAQNKLIEYQRKASLDEKQIAIQQLSTSEKSARDVAVIKDSVLYALVGSDAKTREDVLKSMADNQTTFNESVKDLSTDLAPIIVKGTAGFVTGVQGKAQDEFTDLTGYGPASEEDKDKQNALRGRAQKGVENITKIFDGTDGVIPSNSSEPYVLSKNSLFKGIAGDDVLVGTNLIDAVTKSGSKNLSGSIDININLNGSINGDPGQLAKMFNSPQVQKQIMDTVLYKLNDYKKQQGVIA